MYFEKGGSVPCLEKTDACVGASVDSLDFAFSEKSIWSFSARCTSESQILSSGLGNLLRNECINGAYHIYFSYPRDTVYTITVKNHYITQIERSPDILWP